MISVRTKTREIMLPLLMLPVLIPVIIAAILSTNIFLLGHDITYSYNWIKLMAVFDIIFTAVIFGRRIISLKLYESNSQNYFGRVCFKNFMDECFLREVSFPARIVRKKKSRFKNF